MRTLAAALVRFARTRTVLVVSAAAALATMAFVPPDEAYLGYFDLKTLACLFGILAVVGALRGIGLFEHAARLVVARFATCRSAVAALVGATLVLSMFATNDMALIMMLPLSAATLIRAGWERALPFAFIMQNLAANLGGMILPFGNPQNLFLYERFAIPLGDFLATMAPPFAASIALIALCCALFAKPDPPRATETGAAEKQTVDHAGTRQVESLRDEAKRAKAGQANAKLRVTSWLRAALQRTNVSRETFGSELGRGGAQCAVDSERAADPRPELADSSEPAVRSESANAFDSDVFPELADASAVRIEPAGVSRSSARPEPANASEPVARLKHAEHLESAARFSSGAAPRAARLRLRAVAYVALLALVIASVFRLVPYPAAIAAVVLALAVLDRRALRTVDYGLLLTFACFFVFAGNMARIPAVEGLLSGLMGDSALLVSVGASQIISNVPAAVLLSHFADGYQALLVGVNIGGAGTLVASLASLITFSHYRAVRSSFPRRPELARQTTRSFLARFTAFNVAFLAVLLLACWPLA